MHAAQYAAMSGDPSRNPQFRPGWDDPPDKRRKGARQGALRKIKTSCNTDNLSEQVARLQQAWALV
jgi:hypothetical protein